jgi:hypothetical protein
MNYLRVSLSSASQRIGFFRKLRNMLAVSLGHLEIPSVKFDTLNTADFTTLRNFPQIMPDKLIVRKETHELKILTRPLVREKRFCSECLAEVRWVIPEEAMLLAGISQREVFRLVETRDLHFAENPNGFVIVCADSLNANMKK